MLFDDETSYKTIVSSIEEYKNKEEFTDEVITIKSLKINGFFSEKHKNFQGTILADIK